MFNFGHIPKIFNSFIFMFAEFIFLPVRLVGWLVWGGGGGGWYTIKQPRGKWSGWMVQKMGNQSSELYRENIYIMLHQKWWLGGSSNIQLRDGDSLGGMNCCMVRTNHGSIVYRPLRRPARPKKGLVELYCTVYTYRIGYTEQGYSFSIGHRQIF